MFYPLGLMILLGAAWSLYWFFAFYGTKDVVSQARADLAEQGATLTCARESWGGYPFRIEFACEEAMATVKTGTRTMAFKAKDVAGVMMAYNFRHILAFIDGPSDVDGVSVTHGTARISLEAGPDGAFDITGEAPRVLMASAVGPVEAQMLRLFARRIDGKLDLAAKAEAFSAGGAAFDRVEFQGSTDAAILDAPDPLRQAMNTGQTFEITKAEVAKGDAIATAKGALGLDSAKRPSGKITTETNDIDKLLDALEPALKLSDQNRQALTAMLSIVAKNPASKARSADIVAQNGELYWGPFKLGDLQPIP
jgi:hypothetical protein